MPYILYRRGGRGDDCVLYRSVMVSSHPDVQNKVRDVIYI